MNAEIEVGFFLRDALEIPSNLDFLHFIHILSEMDGEDGTGVDETLSGIAIGKALRVCRHFETIVYPFLRQSDNLITVFLAQFHATVGIVLERVFRRVTQFLAVACV